MTYKKYGPGKYGLAIDFETSGSDFGGKSEDTYQGLSFGAVIFDNETLEELDHCYCEMKFDAAKYKWSADAERIHGMTREYLEEHGMDRQDALVELLNMITKWMGPTPGKVLFLGHNVDFDIGFTNQLAGDFGMEITPHMVNIDTAGLAFALTNLYRSNDVFEMFASEKRVGVHNALTDVRMTLESVRTMKEIFNLGLGALDE